VSTRWFPGASGELEDDESGRTYDLDFETFSAAPTPLVLSDVEITLNQALHLDYSISIEVGPFFGPVVPERHYPLTLVEIMTPDYP
jgi:hypothetical protein